MSVFLVRDDDANATTDPAKLQRAYAPLLDAGIPVSFAVIPEAALDTPGPDGGREGFLSPETAGRTGMQVLTPETPVSAWLRRHAGQVDVFMHGLSHARVRANTEFGALDAAEAKARLALGLATITSALDRRPVGFVAPWDEMSKAALLEANRIFDLVSTGWVGRARLPMSAWPAHALERATKSQVVPLRRGWILRHKGCRIDAATRADAVDGIVRGLAEGSRLTVVVLHHWQLWDGDGPHPAIRELARVLTRERCVGVAGALRELDG